MDTITITKVEFREAVKKAMRKFDSMGDNPEKQDTAATFMMGLQNILFSSVLTEVLFGENKEDK